MQKLQLRQNQSQKLSPQQIQFIKLLQLSNSNIEAEINSETGRYVLIGREIIDISKQ